MKMSAFWWDISESLTPSGKHALPKEVDFVVVGGGYTGLSAGLTIARQGRSVVVLDSGTLGHGASTRNGGICSAQIRLSHSALCAQYGEEFANEVYSEGITARLDLAKFCEEENIECQFQMTGRFTGAMNFRDYESQAREAERLNYIAGHKAYMIARKDQYSEIATDLFFGGMVREEIGGFHPGKFFAGLLKRTEEAGTIVLSNTAMHEVADLSAAGKSVVTSKGTITAGTVIITTNVYTGTKHKVGKFLRKRLVPATSAIIVTEKLGTEKVGALMPRLRMFGNSANLYSYFRPTPDRDRILIGSRSFDRTQATGRTVAYLKLKLTHIFPELDKCDVDYAWLGNVGFTRAQLPVIFEHNDVYYAAGYAGSGTVWAHWMGKKVAETAMGTGNRTSVFYGPPPQSVPLYDGNPWFMPAIQYYFAFKDWVKIRY